MRVAVVGPSGLLGSHLVPLLEAQGHAVHLVSSRDGSGIDPETGRIPDGFELPAGTEVVIYLAQSPRYREGVTALPHLLTVNCVSAVETALAAVRAGVKRFLFASTGSVYGVADAPLSETSPCGAEGPYPYSKLAGERALALLRDWLEIGVVRPFTIYGPGPQNGLIPGLVSRVRAGLPVTLEPRAEASAAEERVDGLRLSLIYAEDAARCVAALATRREPPPNVLNLAGEDAPSIRELATVLGQILGREPRFELAASPRAGDLVADTGLLRSLLNPRFTGLTAGLARTVAGEP